MPFVLPTFNLKCDVWTAGTWPVGPPRIQVDCQLRAPSMQNAGAVVVGALGFPALALLVPAGTDIRDPVATPINSTDELEVPAGSGCFYLPVRVYDIAKGFANEHRYAIIAKLTTRAWPVPQP